MSAPHIGYHEPLLTPSGLTIMNVCSVRAEQWPTVVPAAASAAATTAGKANAPRVERPRRISFTIFFTVAAVSEVYARRSAVAAVDAVPDDDDEAWARKLSMPVRHARFPILRALFRPDCILLYCRNWSDRD